MISLKTLEELTVGWSKRWILKQIKVLKENNWIEVIKVGTQYVYIINERVVWRTYHDKRKRAHFSAMVVVSDKEQTENFRCAKKENLKVITSGGLYRVTDKKTLSKRLNKSITQRNRKGQGKHRFLSINGRIPGEINPTLPCTA